MANKDNIDKETGEVIWDWYGRYDTWLAEQDLEPGDRSQALDMVSDVIGSLELTERNRLVTELNSWPSERFNIMGGVVVTILALRPDANNN